MIIWSRWGFFGVLFAGLGVLLGWLLSLVTGYGEVERGPIVGVHIGLGLMAAAALLRLFERRVVGPLLDAPRWRLVRRELQHPRFDDEGRWLTHEEVPELDPATGEPVVIAPKPSTLFFIPLRWWPLVLAALGAGVCGVSLWEIWGFETRP